MKLQLTAVRIAVAPVDMRLGADGLSLLVQQALGGAPCDGTAYVFGNRRRNRLKLVCWDGNGLWLCQRRLHCGHFVWPQTPVENAIRPIAIGKNSLFVGSERAGRRAAAIQSRKRDIYPTFHC